MDLTDPEDVKVLAADPNGGVLVHLGAGNYLQRYKIYVTHVQQWRQQFDKLESVDLRYDGQIIVNPDLQGMARQPALTPDRCQSGDGRGSENRGHRELREVCRASGGAESRPRKDAKPAAKADGQSGQCIMLR